MGWDLDAMQAMIGRQVVYTAPEPIGRAAIRYFAEAIGDDNPVYIDTEYARAAGHDDVVAPPTLLMETNQYVERRDRDESGYKGHQWDFPVTGCRQIRGGNDYVIGAAAGPDDIVTSAWEIEGVEVKQRSDGSEMLIVTSRATYSRQDGTMLAIDREAIIFQPIPGGGA